MWPMGSSFIFFFVYAMTYKGQIKYSGITRYRDKIYFPLIREKKAKPSCKYSLGSQSLIENEK